MMVFDGHTDLLCDIANRRARGEKDVFRRHHLERFRAGGIEGGVFALWVEPKYTENPARRIEELMRHTAEEELESKTLRIVRTCDEMDDAIRNGIFYAFVGVEGLDSIGDRLEGIDEYYDFGVRLMMLTWNGVNSLAAGAGSGETWGLTDLGKQAVRRIQKKKIIMDVSHLNDAGFWDVIDMSQVPVIASHSNTRALCPRLRNLTDDQLRAIRDTGGVVGLNAYRGFLALNGREQTVEKLAEHAAHMIDIMGIDHVACGFDFCEFTEYTKGSDWAEEDANCNPIGMRTCAQVPKLFECFAQMGMTREDQMKIAQNNFHRVLRQVVG